MYKNINCEVNDALLWNWFNIHYTEMKLIWNKRSHVPWNKFQPTDCIRKQSYKATPIANTILKILCLILKILHIMRRSYVFCLAQKKLYMMAWYEVTRQDLLERSMKRDAIDVCKLTALDLFERDVNIVYLKRSH